MQQILLYSDSLSWGIIPGTRRRLPFAARWAGVMEHALQAQGHAVRIVEDCSMDAPRCSTIPRGRGATDCRGSRSGSKRTPRLPWSS